MGEAHRKELKPAGQRSFEGDGSERPEQVFSRELNAKIRPRSSEGEHKRGVCGGNIKPALPQHSQGRGPFFKPSLPTMQWALLSRQ